MLLANSIFYVKIKPKTIRKYDLSKALSSKKKYPVICLDVSIQKKLENTDKRPEREKVFDDDDDESIGKEFSTEVTTIQMLIASKKGFFWFNQGEIVFQGTQRKTSLCGIGDRDDRRNANVERKN
jgi:hypothetical protein